MWKSPLEIYVAWEPQSKIGSPLARSLFARFSADPDDRLAYGPGIPVYYRSAASNEDAVPKIPWSRSQFSVLIVLADDAMVARKSEWRPWLEEALTERQEAPEQRRLLLVGLSKHFTNLSRRLAAEQAIRLVELVDDLPALEVELLARLSNEICRMIDRARDVEQATCLFLSHAKRDGREAAVNIKGYIEDAPRGDVLFDEVSLQPSKNFVANFRERIAQATMVVLMTDSWASRYWCQWEALQGKELDRPILLVDMLSQGERRHFPYLGNIPVIHCKAGKLGAADCRRIVAAAQLETLRDVHERMRMNVLEGMGRLPVGSRHLARAPELASLVTLFSREEQQEDPGVTHLVYPDPPIADHERALLRRFRKTLTLTTPIELLSGLEGGESPLSGRVVAVSIANSPNLDVLGLGPEHVDQLWVTLSRHLLALGAGVAYGGDLRQGGYTEILLDLVRAYADEGRILDESMVHWYVAWPIHLKLNDAARAELSDVIELHEIGKPDDVNRDAGKFVSVEEDPYAWIRSLTEMRRNMAAHTDARVFVAGQLLASTPRSGIVEEFTLSLRAGQPIYLCGGFGGMTAELIKALRGEVSEPLTDSFHAATDERRRIVELYNASEAGSGDRIDYSTLALELSQAGVEGLRNGLDVEANERLFASQTAEEIVALVRDGLAKALR